MYKIIGADGKEYGPIAAEQIRQWIHEGRVNGQTRVLVEGTTDWKTLAEISELAAMLPISTAPASAPSAPAPFTPAPIVMAPIQGATGVNPLAITGMVLGIVSILFSCCCFGVPWNVAGIVCSGVALSQLKDNPQQEGRGMAIAGLILSLISIGLGVVLKVVLGTTAFLQQFIQKNM